MDADFIHELFGEFGAVSVRRMFGGAGIFAGGVMFGLIIDGQIYLKTNGTTVSVYEAEGCGPFGYDTKHGRRVLTSYWRLPERLYDEPGELAQWARSSLGVARAKAAEKSKPKATAPPAKSGAKRRAKKLAGMPHKRKAGTKSRL